MNGTARGALWLATLVLCRVFRIAQFIKENTVNALKLEIIVQTVMLFVSVGERDLEFGFMKTSETFFPVKHRVLDGKKSFGVSRGPKLEISFSYRTAKPLQLWL